MTSQRTPVTLSLARIAAVLPLLLAPALFAAAGPAHAAPPASAPPPRTLGVGPCDGVETPPGHVCVPAPKQCFAAPCPQYAVVPATEGSEGDEGAGIGARSAS
jgi:hypothetical protein